MIMVVIYEEAKPRIASFNAMTDRAGPNEICTVTREPAAIFFVRHFQSANDGGVKTLTTGEMVGRSRFVHLTQLHICRSSRAAVARHWKIYDGFFAVASFRGLSFRHDARDFIVLP